MYLVGTQKHFVDRYSVASSSCLVSSSYSNVLHVTVSKPEKMEQKSGSGISYGGRLKGKNVLGFAVTGDVVFCSILLFVGGSREDAEDEAQEFTYNLASSLGSGGLRAQRQIPGRST